MRPKTLEETARAHYRMLTEKERAILKERFPEGLPDYERWDTELKAESPQQ